MKKILLIILLVIPFVVYADCNRDKHAEYLKLADNITYDNNYSMSAKGFTVTIYNIFDGMYIMFGEKKYSPDADNIVTISNIKGGTNVILDIYANDGCSQIKQIVIMEPYYNTYYGSKDCYGYEDKLTICSSQFTSSEVTKTILEKSKYNYDNVIVQQEDPGAGGDGEPSLIQKTKDFLLNWGVKFLLLVITTAVCLYFYNDKFRKIKHGI